MRKEYEEKLEQFYRSYPIMRYPYTQYQHFSLCAFCYVLSYLPIGTVPGTCNLSSVGFRTVSFSAHVFLFFLSVSDFCVMPCLSFKIFFTP